MATFQNICDIGRPVKDKVILGEITVYKYFEWTKLCPRQWYKNCYVDNKFDEHMAEYIYLNMERDTCSVGYAAVHAAIEYTSLDPARVMQTKNQTFNLFHFTKTTKQSFGYYYLKC